MISKFVSECIALYYKKKDDPKKPSYWDELIALLTLEGHLNNKE